MQIPKSKIENPKSLRPPQFGLRTLLLAVAGCAVLCALSRWLHPAAVGALAFLAVSIFFHVAGNAIGTRLREIGDQSNCKDSEKAPIAFYHPRPEDFAPVTPLGQRQSLGWTIIVAISIGVTSGAVGGGLWTFVASRGHADALNIAVGIVAFAVLGGMGAFATAAFAQVLAGAIWQAMKAPPTEHSTESALK
jgi:hypothetical protein